MKRLRIADAMKLEAGVTEHDINTIDAAGRAYLLSGKIFSPAGRNMMELYTVAHECGHIFLQRREPGLSLPSHVKEMEADSYAHQAFREHGMTVPHDLSEWGREYVGTWLERDRAAGRMIDPQVAAYVRGDRSPYAPLRKVPPTWVHHLGEKALLRRWLPLGLRRLAGRAAWSVLALAEKWRPHWISARSAASPALVAVGSGLGRVGEAVKCLLTAAGYAMCAVLAHQFFRPVPELASLPDGSINPLVLQIAFAFGFVWTMLRLVLKASD